MKVRTAFTFTEAQLRSVRAAIGRGGKATRKECLTFIDRAVRAAIDAAPEPKPVRLRIVKGENPLAAPVLTETESAEVARRREVRQRIERKFGHTGTGVRGV